MWSPDLAPGGAVVGVNFGPAWWGGALPVVGLACLHEYWPHFVCDLPVRIGRCGEVGWGAITGGVVRADPA